MSISFIGTWSYRSFLNDPNLSLSFDDLRFGAGTLELKQPTASTVRGSLGGDGWSLSLDGTVTDGDPTELKFQGRGTIGGEDWVYDYRGYCIPDWPDGVDQRDAIVGSIIRTTPHSGGTATAGFVASSYAVRA